LKDESTAVIMGHSPGFAGPFPLLGEIQAFLSWLLSGRFSPFLFPLGVLPQPRSLPALGVTALVILLLPPLCFPDALAVILF